MTHFGIKESKTGSGREGTRITPILTMGTPILTLSQNILLLAEDEKEQK